MHEERVAFTAFKDRIMSAAEATRLIKSGMTVGFSGFCTGYPKLVPLAMAEQDGLSDLTLLCGAAFGPHVFGPLVLADRLSRFVGFQFDLSMQEYINAGKIAYCDCHLSQMSEKIRRGDYGKVGVSVIECAKINADGGIVPSVSVGINPALFECSDKIILEVNTTVPEAIEGFHDVLGAGAKQLDSLLERQGETVYHCDPDKIAAVVISEESELDWEFREVNEVYEGIADNVMACLEAETKSGKLSEGFTFQIGAGGVANAVLLSLKRGGYRNLKMFTEVFTTAALEYVEDGLISEVSTTCFDMARLEFERVYENLEFFRDKVVVRAIEYTNSPANISAMNVVSMNTAVEADIYGNVNSTNVLGSKMIHGIGGANDFARSAALTIFFTPSTAKNGKISSIVPMASHVDCTEHDTDIIITECGWADLRGLSPKERAERIIENCAHPDYREALREYYRSAVSQSGYAQTPHDLDAALSMHSRCKKTGSMK